MATGYHHSQAGIVILLTVGIAAAGIIFAVYEDLMPPGALVLAGALAICMWIFGSQTVDVGAGLVTVRFGPGLVRRQFKVGEILRAKTVRNRWYMGWGIHRLPGGWLYNVSGLDAVEIELRNGQVHRIGTDEPDALAAAIREAGGLPAN